MSMTLLRLFPHLYITFLADRRGVNRISQELASYQDLRANEGRWKVEPLVDPKGPELSDDQQDEITEEVTATFDAVFDRLLKGDDLKEGFGKVPNGVIIDVSYGRRGVSKGAHGWNNGSSIVSRHSWIRSARRRQREVSRKTNSSASPVSQL